MQVLDLLVVLALLGKETLVVILMETKITPVQLAVVAVLELLVVNLVVVLV
jgi:hypothetical protein